MQLKFHWHYINKDVREYIQMYNVCQKIVLKTYLLYSKFESLLILKRLWQKIVIDFITSFPLTMFRIQKINIILIVVDCFIKYIIFIFIRSDINTVELVKLIYSHIDIQFGLLSNIVFNCNLIFINEFWSSFYYYNKIKRCLTIIYHLQTDK